MLPHTASTIRGPLGTSCPELLLAALALLEVQEHRATERDLMEALTMPLVEAASWSGRAARAAAG